MRLDRNGGPRGAAAPRLGLLGPLATIAMCALLAGCGGGEHKPPPELIIGDELSTETVAFADGAGLRLPRHLDGFERSSLVSAPKHGGATAIYEAAGTTITIRVRRVGEGRTLFTAPPSTATSERSAVALAREIASLRAAEPDLREGPASDLYLVRFGAIQAGKTTTLDSGATRVDAFCCVNAIWSYVFETSGGDADGAARFIRDLAWSASESASVEEPR